jgi:hypothetical protein
MDDGSQDAATGFPAGIVVAGKPHGIRHFLILAMAGRGYNS